FCTSIHNIEPIAKVNEENRSNHDNEHRSAADPEEDAGRDRQPSANLGRANQNCQEGWPVMRLGERLQPRSSEPSEQDGASVIEKRRPTGKSQKQERQIDTSDLPCLHIGRAVHAAIEPPLSPGPRESGWRESSGYRRPVPPSAL